MFHDIASNKDYLKIIKAVLDSAAVDYVKLQHPANRKKKSLKQSYIDSVEIYFNKDFRFEHFTDPTNEDYHFSTKELLSFLLETNKINLQGIQEHLISEAISYWWEKNFHDMSIPTTIVLAGKVFKICHSPKKHFVDYENNIIYCSTSKRGGDRLFFKLCFEIILKHSDIDLPKDKFDEFTKFFYLFLKVNAAFEEKKK
jgi:hypothetical protein